MNFSWNKHAICSNLPNLLKAQTLHLNLVYCQKKNYCFLMYWNLQVLLLAYFLMCFNWDLVQLLVLQQQLKPQHPATLCRLVLITWFLYCPPPQVGPPLWHPAARHPMGRRPPMLPLSPSCCNRGWPSPCPPAPNQPTHPNNCGTSCSAPPPPRPWYWPRPQLVHPYQPPKCGCQVWLL